ncbi:MAG: vitamin K epoxide reductase family protein [Kofleriaceae bacterium]
MKDRSLASFGATFGALGAAVVGFAASLATAIDDLGPAPTFCARSCEVVRSSAWARPLGIPMSLLGVAFFAAMIALAFIDRPRLRRGLAVAGAAWAIWLVVLQGFVIGAWCKLCLVADPAAIIGAACVLAGARTLGFAWSRAALGVAAVAGIVLALAVWTRSPELVETADGPVPAFVSRSQAPGKVTIVEVVDFECPFCRKMQTRIDDARARTQVPVQVERKMMPLSMHEYAIPAAVAFCCADAQGKGEEMARG